MERNMGVNSITKTKPVAKEFSPMQMALGTRDPSKTTRCTDLVSNDIFISSISSTVFGLESVMQNLLTVTHGIISDL